MEEVGLVRIVASFAFVIGLILLFSWGAKYLRGSKWAEKVQGERRLQLVEQLYLDARHKLVLVKYDQTEQLLLIGEGKKISEQPITVKKKTPKKEKAA